MHHNVDTALESPFGFLDSTLNALVIEDDPLSKTFIEDFLEPIKVFTIHSVSTTTEALALLRSGTRFHICIMDLGMSDVQNDEFYILRQYSQHCSIIVLTGCSSPHKGATSIQLGARAVFEKGANNNYKQLLESIQRYTLINLVYPRYAENNNETITISINILFEKNPGSVTAWAEHLRISDRQLRNVWHTGSGFGAKYILYIYTLYASAFSYYSKVLFGKESEIRDNPNSVPESRLANYFHSNRETIQFILS